MKETCRGNEMMFLLGIILTSRIDCNCHGNWKAATDERYFIDMRELMPRLSVFCVILKDDNASRYWIMLSDIYINV